MLERVFRLADHGTTVGREAVAGLTTFATTAYILVVHPGVLAAAGFDRGASVTATALVGLGGTLAMGLFAKRPFVVAPYMGENAFIAFTVVGALGHTPEAALGAVLIGGVLFALLTLAGLRAWLARSIPRSLKFGFVVGIGLFLTFIGLQTSGIVVQPPGETAPPVTLGDTSDPEVLLAVAGLVLMLALHLARVRAGILIAIALITATAALLGLQDPPESWLSPPRLEPLFLSLDVQAALSMTFVPIVLTLFIIDFVDSLGTLIGVSARAGFLDENGNLPGIERPMLVDSLSTVGAALLGTTTSGPFIESATGVEAGGRSGLTAVVCALCFVPALFLADVLAAVPACAYGPALVLVGTLMFESARHIDFRDETEAIPAFLAVALMVFTYNIGQGVTAGLVSWPLLKTVRGRAREVPWGLWILAALSLAYYAAEASLE